MSELAFNLSGEPFEVPGAAFGWRVRKLKPKGAPETVYGRDGIPLILPVDADMNDLRQEARSEGRYRLDPVDDHGRTILNAPAGYVCIHPPERIAEPPPAPPSQSHGPTDPIVEAMRMNTEIARTVIDRFPVMVESVAGLLRAADGAGLPAREPRGPMPVTDDHSDEAADDEEAPKASRLAGIIEALLPTLAPMIMSAVASGKLPIPGGLGALFDCRRASEAGTRTAGPPDAVPPPGPRDPAAARRRAPTFRTARARGTDGDTSAVARAKPMPVEASASASPANAGDRDRDTNAHGPTGTPAAPVPADLPTLDPEALVHFAAIQEGLTLREKMLAQALAAELSPTELRGWLTELMSLSVAEAIAEIRTVLGPDAERAPNAGPGPAVLEGGAP